MIRANDMAKLLAPYYPQADMFSVSGKLCPLRLIAAAPDQMEHPDSILGALDLSYKQEIDPLLREKGDEHIKALLDQGVGLVDLPTFCLKKLEVGSGGIIRIECYMDSYFNMLRTCETLEQEAVTALNGSNVGHETKRKLALRNRVHGSDKNGSYFFPPPGVSSALGISTLIVCRKEQSYSMLIGKRGNTSVAIGRGVSHVIPACMFQPISSSIESEYDIPYNVFREYLEELFSIEEDQTHNSAFEKNKVLCDPNILFLNRLEAKGRAKLYFTGCIVNLVSQRLDICALLFIDDPSWYESHNNGSDGFAVFEFNKEWETIEEIDLGASPVPASPESFITTDLSLAGAGAIWLGFECLRRMR